MDNLKQLEHFYENEGEEELRLQIGGVHYLEYLTAVNYLDRFLPADASVLDSCAGTGAYAFYLAGKGHRVTAGDIVGHNVRAMREKQRQNPPLECIYQGDALDLSHFADGSFDAVLLMGALYHLHESAQRRLAVSESIRVLKDGGLLFFTYMNRYAVILNNACGDLTDIADILRFADEGKEGVFYASTPEEMETLALDCGIKKVCHTALDGMGYFMRETAGLLTDAGFLRWREYHFAVCETPSLLGGSYHNMIVARKTLA